MVVNIKNIKIGLSSKELDGLIDKLNKLKKGLDKADKNIVKEMAQFAKDEVSTNLAETPYRDGNDESVAFLEINGKKAKAGMRGKQVAYNEFGTGTMGEQSPHPEKSNFGLRDYNTGKTIRKNKKSNSDATAEGIPINGMYWTYNYNGQKKYTQGIPAGKQVYKASEKLRTQKEKIIKQEVGEVISKL